MINIKLICVGSLKEKYLKEMNAEYLKRLSKYCKFEVIELKDEKLPDTLNNSNMQIIKQKEAQNIINKLNNISNPYLFVLDEKGKEYSSCEFAKKLNDLPVLGNSTIVFVIGGSLGLTDEIRSLSNEVISFSKLTFPHQLIRMFLLEQLFRCFKINNNETYHH